jgi:hypothetical protein
MQEVCQIPGWVSSPGASVDFRAGHNRPAIILFMQTAVAVKVPALLSFDHSTPGKLVPGRGEAGWTVYEFATVQDAVAFMDLQPASAMPCWPRLRQQLGA